ncbi:hypothetical protein MHSWG343_06530 [Candidatus Mycoplasma haematohominis]|uniref:Uncharacterized protein n=1 Tax=Candidatus Mycoplasma haematohominis TaxID=1494318 RepID=A0A478FQD1_9MOLU|nr:hypothetical protein MHSWG343_06530 [Candidatus Mycoplasma haemohominis]
MDPTKLAVGAGTAVLVGGGGYGVSALFSGDGMPDYVVLSVGNPSPTANTLGNLYGNYLVAPYGSRGKESTGDVTKSNNSDWWEWSYKRWEKDLKKGSTLSDEFKDNQKINGAFSITTPTSGTAKALNQVCEEVYGKQKEDITHDTGNPNKKNLDHDLWKYCSFFTAKPKTISETYSNGSYGLTKKAELISVKDSSNSRFREARNKEFYASSGDKSGTNATSGVFKTAFDGRNKNKKHVREICSGAYSITKTNNETSYPENDVVKFCSLG